MDARQREHHWLAQRARCDRMSSDAREDQLATCRQQRHAQQIQSSALPSQSATEEAKIYAVNGSPEAPVFSTMRPEGIPRAELEKNVGSQIFSIGSSQAVKNKWLEIGKELVSSQGDDIHDTLNLLLNNIEDGKAVDDKDIAAPKKRKLITLQTWKGYSLKKGPKYAPEIKKPTRNVTHEHLQKGD